MGKGKKVLFVATVVKTHINVFHLPYLKWFQEQGYETHVCAKNDFEEEECIIPYCDVHYDIPFERSPIHTRNVKAYKELKRIINQNEYDIIHCHTPVAAMLARLAAIKARSKGTKVIYTAHGFHFFKGAPLINWLVYYPVEWICSWLTDVLITINQEDYELAKEKMRARIIEYVHGIGVDTEKGKNIIVDKLAKRAKLGVPEDAIVLLSVGELSKRKNHEVAIRAVAQINNENLYYVICGQGLLLDQLQQLSKELKIENQVIFAGFRKDIIEVCKLADIYVFPSLQEGLPAALMEAMSVGLPCVVSEIRGNIDLIENNMGGYLCKCKSIDEFANRLIKLIKQDKLREQMGKHNLEVIKQFDILKVKEEMIKIYSEANNG